MSFTFNVEPGKVREVVDALRHSGRVQGAQPLGRGAAPESDAVVPLVFTRATVFQEPEGATVNRLIGVDPSHMRHAGQAWTVHEPLRVGRSYTVTPWTLAREETKRSRSGSPLRFVTAERGFLTGNGAAALTERMITVVVGPVSPASSQAQVSRPDSGAMTKARPPSLHTDWRGAAPGAALAQCRFDALTRTDFVRFAGAIGDFTPMHHDPDLARRSGLADVIAMGTLPMGLVLAVMEQGLGADGLSEVEVRFHEPLYPGLALDLSVTAAQDTAPDAPHALFDLRTENRTRIVSGDVRGRGR
jgi:acyl dehydratase